MIKVNNKFEIGQEVYYIGKEGKCAKEKIAGISVVITEQRTSVSYILSDNYKVRLEEELFENPEELRRHVFESTLDFE